MHHEDIKAAIRKMGVTPADIAATLEVSDQTVSAVIRGKTKSERVASAIASVTGIAVDQLWPGAYEAPANTRKTVELLLKRVPPARTTRAARKAA